MSVRVRITVAEVAKQFPAGSLCWLVNADNDRHADEVIVIGRPTRPENRASDRLWVPVRSLVDGSQYETRHTNLVHDAAVKQDGVLADMQRQRGELAVKLADRTAHRAQWTLGQEMANDIWTANKAKRDAAWTDVVPEVVGDVLTPAGRRVTVRITGIEYPAYSSEKGSHLRRDEYEVTVLNGQVSWASFGQTAPALAAAYARAILVATSIAAEAR